MSIKKLRIYFFHTLKQNTGGKFRIYLNKIIFCDTFNINYLQGKLLKFKGDSLPERENKHSTHKNKIHTKSLPQLQI